VIIIEKILIGKNKKRENDEEAVIDMYVARGFHERMRIG